MKYVYKYSQSYDKAEEKSLEAFKTAQNAAYDKFSVVKSIISEWANLSGNDHKILNWKQKLESNTLTDQDIVDLKKDLQFIVPLMREVYTRLNQLMYKI